MTQSQITKLRKKISNNMSADIKLSKAEIKKITQSGGFLGRLLGKLILKMIPAGTLLVKNIAAPLGLSAAMSGIDVLIQKSVFSSSDPQSGGNKLDDIVNVLKISNSGLNRMMEILKVLENHDILPKRILKQLKMK